MGSLVNSDKRPFVWKKDLAFEKKDVLLVSCIRRVKLHPVIVVQVITEPFLVI